MAFKDIAKSAFELPATILSGATSLLFGSYQKNKEGEIKYTRDENNQRVALTNPGLFGYIAMGITYGFRAVGNFVSNHKTAIATAFWASLVVAGAAALTLALWPAALAAVAGFSVFGLSIAAVVGTGVVAQVGVAAALAAAATSVAVYAGAAVVNGINAVIGFVAERNSKSRSDVLLDETPRSKQFSGLNSTSSYAGYSAAPAPGHFRAPVDMIGRSNVRADADHDSDDDYTSNVTPSATK